MSASITLARAVTSALVFAPGFALASQFDYSLYASMEHSDNITLNTSNPISQDILSPGINFMYAQQGSAFQANVAGTLQYNDYFGSRFDNQTQTELAGQGNWTVLPQRLDFSVEDSAGIEPVNSLASDAPNNQQQTNVVSLGPTLHMQFGDAMRAQFELRYLNSYASKVEDFNSQRGDGAFRLFRDISQTDQLSLNVESQRVSFDDSTLNPSYTRDEIYGRYVSTLANFDADVLLGWAHLDFNGAPSDSKPMARATFGWHLSSMSGISVSGAYEFSDAAQDMLQQPGQSILNNVNVNPTDIINNPGGTISAGNLVIDSEVYLEKSLAVTYTYRTEQMMLTIAPEYDKLSYLNDPTFDQSTRGGGASLDFHLNPTTTITGFIDAQRLVYTSLDRTDKTYRYGVDLSHRWTSHWTWHVSYIRQLRNSTAVAQSYHENEVFFSVVYRR